MTTSEYASLDSSEIYLGVALSAIISGFLQVVLRNPFSWRFYLSVFLGTLTGLVGWYAETKLRERDAERKRLLGSVALASLLVSIYKTYIFVRIIKEMSACDVCGADKFQDWISPQAPQAPTMEEVYMCVGLNMWCAIVHLFAAVYSVSVYRDISPENEPLVKTQEPPAKPSAV
jgi:hypothetical protein